MADFLTPVEVMQKTGVMPGLVFRMDKKQLVEHLKARAVYHRKRAGEKEGEVPGLMKMIADMKESIEKIKGYAQQQAPTGGSGSPMNFTSAKTAGGYGFDPSSQVAAMEQQVEALRKDVKDHTNRALMFDGMSGCLFDAVYALTWQDLAAIEFVK